MGSYGRARRLVGDVMTQRGRRSLAYRVVDRLGKRIPPDIADNHILASDLVTTPNFAPPTKTFSSGEPLRIGWVIAPPVPGSGGHTTAFRMVEALEAKGHKCDLLLYDPFGTNASERTLMIRNHWPSLRAAVRSIDEGFNGIDVAIATGWQTAHALGSRTARTPLHRLYFAQDYEPFFYPRGFEYAQAEQTYLFGFDILALGRMVTRHLGQLGVRAIEIPFGCDTTTYHLAGNGSRSGIVFYSRAGTSRRGFLLARMGLAELRDRRPDIPIRVYGPARRADFSFDVDWQGVLKPGDLNRLYNSSVCGLGISFTNISLVVGEMLAAGCAPVVNDSADGRLDMDSPHVTWVRPTPTSVANALIGLVDDPPSPEALANPTQTTWRESAKIFVESVESIARGAHRG